MGFILEMHGINAQSEKYKAASWKCEPGLKLIPSKLVHETKSYAWPLGDLEGTWNYQCVYTDCYHVLSREIPDASSLRVWTCSPRGRT